MDLHGGWRTDGAENKVLGQREMTLKYGTQPEQALKPASDKTQKKEKPDTKALSGTRCLMMFGTDFA